MAKRKMKSRRQPSLPGFPDMPGKIEIQIPKMPMWKQISGDVDAGGSGALLARSDGDALELLEIQPVREYVGDKEAAEIGFPFWTKEAYFDLEDLDPKDKEVKSALTTSGFYDGDQRIWFEEEATPEERALAIAEALLRYGRGEEGNSGWAENVVPDKVEWYNGEIAGPEHIADADESFRDDVLGYSDIRQKIEELVEQMIDESAATAWSTVGDQAANDAEKEGFDPNSLVGVAEFGNAVAVDGNLETEKTFAGVGDDLEAQGYEETDIGGKVPTTEAYADADSVVRVVAKEMDVDEETVKKAAKGIEWWSRLESGREISGSTSGWAIVYGKKTRGTKESRRRPRRRR